MSNLLTWATRAPDGEFWECGVHRGLSAAMLAQVAPGVLRLFDTFCGRPPASPEDGTCSPSQFDDTSLEHVQQRVARSAAPGLDVRYHVGQIPATLAGTEDARIGFAYVDLDLYLPTRAAVAWIWPRLVPGGILLVDDAWGLAQKRWPGVHRAVTQFPEIPWQVDAPGRMVAIHA